MDETNMDDDLSKLAESLHILTLYGQSILESLSRTKQWTCMPTKSSPSSASNSNPSASTLSSSNVSSNASLASLPISSSPISTTSSSSNSYLHFFKSPTLLSFAQTLAKKFPEIESVHKQTKEYKEFMESFKELKEELKPIYQIFTCWVDFMDSALRVLNACTHLTVLDMDLNPDLTYPFLVLAYQVWISFHLIQKMKKSKKAIASAVHLLETKSSSSPFSGTSGGAVPETTGYHSKITDYFISSDALYPELLKLTTPFSELLLKTILAFKSKLESITFANAAALRNHPWLEVMDMGLIDVNNFLVLPLPMHFLGQTSLFSNSMICLLLSRPSILLNDSHLSQFLKLVDTNGTFTHVATFDTFHSQAEFEGIMKVSSKFSKLKNLMCENSTKQKHLHIQFHEDRRQFLIERISYVCMLCQDQPTLIPMNLFPLLTLLQLSRDEIVWYMMHPEDDRKSSQKAFHKSNEVLALIHWVLETKQVLLNYSDQVTSVILQRIKSEWAQTFQQAYTALIALPDLPPAVSEILNDMHQIYRDLSPATIASLERLRMNWARLQVYFSLPGAVLSISSMPHITSTLNTLSVMSTYIDRYTSYIDQVTDLSLLLTYKEVWYSMVMDTLRQSQGIPYLRYVPKLLMSFSTLPFHYLQPSSNFKHPLVFDLIDHFFNALAQVSMQYTFYSVQVKIEMDHAQFSAFEGSFSEVFAKEKKKGLGQYYSNKVLQDLKFLRQRISECLSIFQAYPIITTPSFNFIPSQYLEEHLTHSYQAFLQSFIYDHHLMNSKDAPIVEDASYVILKPSLILRDLQLLLEECLRMTWGLPEVSFVSILENVLIQQNDLQNTTTFQENIPDIVYSRTSPTKKKAVKPPSNKPPYTVGLSNYYVEVFTYRTLFHKVLSSPHMLTLRSDCDCHELSALLTLLGPNGMHYLDTKLLKNMSALGSYTINQCQHYMSLLTVSPESLSSNFTSYLVKMKNIDEIFQKTCAFGIMNDIRNLYFKLYFRNFRFKPIANLLSACITYGSIVSPKTIEEDALANKLFRKAQSLNINNNIDSALVQQSDFIRALQPSQETYVSLTTYLALLICYVSTKEIFKYIPYADANVNNAQGIVGAIHAILTKSMTKFSECSKKQCQLLEQTTFSLASSWLLHSLVNRATATKETNAIYSDSAFMVLSKLGDISGKMGQDWLETYIGTALFQTIHSKLLRRRFLKLQNSEIDKEQEKGLSEVMA